MERFKGVGFTFASKQTSGFMSHPTERLRSTFAVVRTLPLPQKGSKITSPSAENFRMCRSAVESSSQDKDECREYAPLRPLL